MKINDILELFLAQEFEIYHCPKNDKKDFVSISVPDWNCHLEITNTKTNGVTLSLSYNFDSDGRSLHSSNDNIVRHYIKDVNEIKPFLDRIFQRTEDSNNEMFCPSAKVKVARKTQHKIANLFKQILAEETLPSKYSFEILEEKAYPHKLIRLIEKGGDYIYEISFSQFFDGAYVDTVSSMFSALDINVGVRHKDSNPTSAKNLFFFSIPGYDLPRYPLLKELNKTHKIYNHMEDWLKEVIEYPNVPQNGLQTTLKYHLMNDSVPKKDEDVKVKKNKI